MIIMCPQTLLKVETYQSLPDELWNNIVIIGTILGIVAAVAGLVIFYDWIRPKAKNITVVCSYIDYETDEMVEEKKMEIVWPRFPFFKSISLPRFSREAKYEIAYKAEAWPKKELERSQFTVSEAGKHRKIRLVNKEFCKENDVEHIFVKYFVPQGNEYRNHIREIREKTKIVVLNDNLTEIWNYKVLFPQKVTMDKANRYFLIAERFETDQSGSEEATIVALVLRPLPPRGRVEIPI